MLYLGWSQKQEISTIEQTKLCVFDKDKGLQMTAREKLFFIRRGFLTKKAARWKVIQDSTAIEQSYELSRVLVCVREREHY